MRPVVLALVALLAGVAATNDCPAAGGSCVSSCSAKSCQDLVEKKFVYWTSKQCSQASDSKGCPNGKVCCIPRKATQDEIDEYNYREAQKACDEDCIRLKKPLKTPEPKACGKNNGFCLDDCTSACRGIHAKLGYQYDNEKYDSDKRCGPIAGSTCEVAQTCCGLYVGTTETMDALPKLPNPPKEESASHSHSHDHSSSSSSDSEEADHHHHHHRVKSS